MNTPDKPDLQKMQREVAIWLGLQWIDGQFGHEGKHRHGTRHDDGSIGTHYHHHHDDRCINPNPDFIRNPVELLRLMTKNVGYIQFCVWIGSQYNYTFSEFIKLITDQTGLLLIKVWDWKEKQ